MRQIDLDDTHVFCRPDQTTGEAAFYGPKLDVQVRNGRGHEETVATVQLDFNQPERVDLAYVAPNGSRERFSMTHHGTVGAMERVLAMLLERYQGRLPLWLAPVQVRVLPVSANEDLVARLLLDRVCDAGIRAGGDWGGLLAARVRANRVRRNSVLAIPGRTEAGAETVEVVDVRAGFRGPIRQRDLVAVVRDATEHRLSQAAWPDATPTRDGEGPVG